jgi:hypothetical protein
MLVMDCGHQEFAAFPKSSSDREEKNGNHLLLYFAFLPFKTHLTYNNMHSNAESTGRKPVPSSRSRLKQTDEI